MTNDEYGYDIPEAQDIHQGGGVIRHLLQLVALSGWTKCLRQPVKRCSAKNASEWLWSRTRFVILCFLKWNFYTIRSLALISWSPMRPRWRILDPIWMMISSWRRWKGRYSRIWWMESHRNERAGSRHSQPPANHCSRARSLLSCLTRHALPRRFLTMKAILSALSMRHRTPQRSHPSTGRLASRNIENWLSANNSESLIPMFHARHEYLPTTSVAMIAVMIMASLKAQTPMQSRC